MQITNTPTSGCQGILCSNSTRLIALVSLVVGGVLLSIQVSPAAGYALLGLGGGVVLANLSLKYCGVSNKGKGIDLPKVSPCAPFTSPLPDGTCFLGGCTLTYARTAGNNDVHVIRRDDKGEFFLSQWNLRNQGLTHGQKGYAGGMAVAQDAKLFFYPPFVTDFEGNEVGLVECFSEKFPENIFTSNDGKILVAVSEFSWWPDDNKFLEATILRQSGQEWKRHLSIRVDMVKKEKDDEVYDLIGKKSALSPDGQQLAVSCWQSTTRHHASGEVLKEIRIYSTKDGSLIRTIDGPFPSISPSCISLVTTILQSMNFTSEGALTAIFKCDFCSYEPNLFQIYSWNVVEESPPNIRSIKKISVHSSSTIQMALDGETFLLENKTTATRWTRSIWKFHIIKFKGDTMLLAPLEGVGQYDTTWYQTVKLSPDGRRAAIQFYKYRDGLDDDPPSRLEVVDLPNLE